MQNPTSKADEVFIRCYPRMLKRRGDIIMIQCQTDKINLYDMNFLKKMKVTIFFLTMTCAKAGHVFRHDTTVFEILLGYSFLPRHKAVFACVGKQVRHGYE